MMFGMGLSEEMTSAWLQAGVGFTGVLVGSVVAWMGDAKRSRDSRRYDRRVRQLDEMCDLVDALEALERAPYDGTMRAEIQAEGNMTMEDLAARYGTVTNRTMLDRQSERARGLITRAERYWYDPEVGDELGQLRNIWKRNTEVAAGIDRHAVVPDEAPPSTEQSHSVEPLEGTGDASTELSRPEWVQGMIASARRCIELARHALNEDTPSWWQRARRRMNRLLTQTYGRGRA
jgi:hypothetical protein